MAEVLATKYRPKRLKHVVGQEVTKRIIENAFNAKNLHKAYLFCGQMGTGKTSLARILAASENCLEKGRTLDPCGACKNCRAIFAGNSVDIKEMDAASNRGIDDIRALKNEILHAPIGANVKYIIIDEAHSLTDHAAQALLKALEEPPSHVRFILCTTDPHKIIPTIHSRCCILEFNKVSWFEIFRHLETIVKSENIEADEEALKIIAKNSESSVRTALQNLEKSISYTDGQKITKDEVIKALGFISDEAYFDLLKAVIETRMDKAVLAANKLSRSSNNSEKIFNGLLEHLRKILLIRVCNKDLTVFGISEAEEQRLKTQSSLLEPRLVSRLISILKDTKSGMLVNMDITTMLEKWSVDAVIETNAFSNSVKS
jgi:DNA polymerase-3 subunit gamma/tau